MIVKLSTETKLVLFVALVNFVNILDFMMVMPLGPDFAKALAISPKYIGIIGGSYTFAAAISGLVASFFLDNYNRKSAMLFTLSGLIIATASAALAWNTESLIFARLLAGIFGGPLSSLSLAMISDHIPAERRGRAIAKVMSAFSVAAVLGVPFGLELTTLFSWKAPFIVLSLFSLLVLLMGTKFLPKTGVIISVMDIKKRLKSIQACFSKSVSLAAFAYTSLAMLASFLLIPNISAHLQMNLNYPRQQLGMLYFYGGTIAFLGMLLVGRLVDKFSSSLVSVFATTLVILSIAAGFIWYNNFLPTEIIFVIFMLGTTTRNVCSQTLSSRIPAPDERASFMSLLSFFTHLASSLGAFIATTMLSHAEDGTLQNIPKVALLSIVLSCLVPILLYKTEKKL